MERISSRWTSVLGLAVVVAIAGCKSGGSASGAAGGDTGKISMNGAGATFPSPIYSKWFSEYATAHPDVHINYQPIGSGGGIKQVTDGIVDFGASDVTMTDEQIAGAKVQVMAIPTVLGAVVPIYNLPGIAQDLNFSPDVIANIYLGKITKWNDPRIAKDNPGVKLPATTILPVYRSEGSGTTFIFTDFLTKTSPAWAAGPGKGSAIKWPVGVGQKGSEGLTGMVRESPGAFGYVELVYATKNNIQYGLVKNAAGKFVKGSTAGVTAAAANVPQMPADYRVSITNAPGDDSYPISSFTWLLVPTHFTDPAKGKVMHDFLGWMLDAGEAEAPGMSYASLPGSVAESVRKTIAQVQ